MLAENLNYSELKWFLFDGAVERGPFLTSEMLYKYKKGTVTNFTKVKNENMDYWIPYNSSILAAKEFSSLTFFPTTKSKTIQTKLGTKIISVSISKEEIGRLRPSNLKKHLFWVPFLGKYLKNNSNFFSKLEVYSEKKLNNEIKNVTNNDEIVWQRIQEQKRIWNLDRLAQEQIKQNVSLGKPVVKKAVNLKDLLKSEGFPLLRKAEVHDKRNKGGCFWVIGGLELKQEMKNLAEMGIHFEFTSKGGRTSGYRASWYMRSYLLRDRFVFPIAERFPI